MTMRLIITDVIGATKREDGALHPIFVCNGPVDIVYRTSISQRVYLHISIFVQLDYKVDREVELRYRHNLILSCN